MLYETGLLDRINFRISFARAYAAGTVTGVYVSRIRKAAKKEGPPHYCQSFPRILRYGFRWRCSGGLHKNHIDEAHNLEKQALRFWSVL